MIVVVVPLLLLSGCVPSEWIYDHDELPHPSYDEARTRLIDYVDGTFAAALPDHPKPAPPLVSENLSCNDAYGAPVDEVSLTYQYEVSVDVEDSSAILDRVEASWRASGFSVERDTGTPGLLVSFATLGSTGYHLSVAVHENRDQIRIGGTSPCVRTRLREELERLDEESRRDTEK